jgi:hypothetical protein
MAIVQLINERVHMVKWARRWQMVFAHHPDMFSDNF